MNNIKTACVIHYGDGSLDPPTIQACRYLQDRGFDVTLITSPTQKRISTEEAERNLNIAPSYGFFRYSQLPHPLKSLLRWAAFKNKVKSTIRETRASLIVPIMFHGLASLPNEIFYPEQSSIIFSCIYDIPSENALGRLDRQIYKRGIERLTLVDGVWASDAFKLDLIGRRVVLPNIQHVCHNCPQEDFPGAIDRETARKKFNRLFGNMHPSLAPEDQVWVRAGGVGPYSALLETLKAFSNCSGKTKFVIMGRPDPDYLGKLRREIASNNLKDRVILLDRPQSSVWSLVLAAADYGHLIHTCPKDQIGKEIFESNSSLSNNGFFQFMAASMPFVVLDDYRHRTLLNTHLFIDFVDPQHLENDINEIVKRLENDTTDCVERGRIAREEFLTTYNWEKQFEPVFKSMVYLLDE